MQHLNQPGMSFPHVIFRLVLFFTYPQILMEKRDNSFGIFYDRFLPPSSGDRPMTARVFGSLAEA